MKRTKRKDKKKWVITALVFLVLLFLFYAALEWFVYPPLHRERPSPKSYLRQESIFHETKSSLTVWEHGARDKKNIALTFDADMTPGMKLLLDKRLVKSWYNRGVKDILDKEQAEATVFLGGLWTKVYPKEAKELAGDPLIEIGNHSYNHYAFTKKCFGLLPFIGGKRDDVAEAQDIIRQTTGVTPKYFRFPGGCYDRVDLETVANLGLEVVHWDTVANDGFNNNTLSIIRKVESEVQNGSIIVFHIHDGNLAPRTAEALKQIIPDLRSRGFKFVKVSELLGK